MNIYLQYSFGFTVDVNVNRNSMDSRYARYRGQPALDVIYLEQTINVDYYLTSSACVDMKHRSREPSNQINISRLWPRLDIR